MQGGQRAMALSEVFWGGLTWVLHVPQRTVSGNTRRQESYWLGHLPSQTQTPGGGRSGHIWSSAQQWNLTKQGSGQTAPPHPTTPSCLLRGRPACCRPGPSVATFSLQPLGCSLWRGRRWGCPRGGTGFWWQRPVPVSPPLTRGQGLREPQHLKVLLHRGECAGSCVVGLVAKTAKSHGGDVRRRVINSVVNSQLQTNPGPILSCFPDCVCQCCGVWASLALSTIGKEYSFLT